MLVLTRKAGESIDVFDTDGRPLVSVCLVKMKGKTVRVGLIARKEVVILRKELTDGNSPDQIKELVCHFKHRLSGESCITTATDHQEENLNLFQELPS